jgi:hypothetical protein
MQVYPTTLVIHNTSYVLVVGWNLRGFVIVEDNTLYCKLLLRILVKVFPHYRYFVP